MHYNALQHESAYARLGRAPMTSMRNIFNVTIAFFVGGSAVSFVLYALVSLGFLTELARGGVDWFALSLAIASFAALSGLIVDAMRLLAGLLWRGKPPYRLKLRKILKQNLA